MINNPFLHETETLLIAKGFKKICELDCVKKVKLKNKKIKTIILKENVLKNYYAKAAKMGVDEVLPLSLSKESIKELLLKNNKQSSLFEIAKNKTCKCLTAREEEILILMMEGAQNIEMANKLHISKRTVEFHKANIRAKLGKNFNDYAKYLNEKQV